MKMNDIIRILSIALSTFYAHAGTSWVVDSQEEWEQTTSRRKGIQIDNGVAQPEVEKGAFTSRLKSYDEKKSLSSITLDQSPLWLNWEQAANIGTKSMRDAPVLLSVGPNNYWMLGRYNSKVGGKKAKKPFTPQPATLEGFDEPLLTTAIPNEFEVADKKIKPSGGYHAWHSKDMKNWVHYGPVTDKHARWTTTAEYADGKFYIYYDFPNDQDPHVYVDTDLTDGKPGEDMGMAFKDPSHGSDCGVIRGADGKFHLIYENWDHIDASKNAWDAPVAGHAVSDTGLSDFNILAPAVDLRTKPTGKKATFIHPHWPKEDPENYASGEAEYEIHEPEQEAFGDWAAISIGGRYYLFGDYDRKDGEPMSAAWFTSSSLDEQFTFCSNIGVGHPDPDICFAEGKFYLATQQSIDYVSDGPWVESVEVRVGVDTDNDKKVDHWSEWREVKEVYDHTPGFAKQVQKTAASMDLSSLPAGYGFQFEVNMTDTTGNKSKPALDKVTVSFAD